MGDAVDQLIGRSYSAEKEGFAVLTGDVACEKDGGYKRFGSTSSRSAFTMVEVIAVLLLIAIMGAVATTKLVQNNNSTQISEKDFMKGVICYVRASAMASTSLWAIAHNSTSYKLYRNGAQASIPGSVSGLHNLPSGLTLSSSANGLGFNQWGIPCTTAGAQLSSDYVITVSDGSNPAQPITITKNTGFIR